MDYTFLALFMQFTVLVLHNRRLMVHNYPSPYHITTSLGGGKCKKPQYIVVVRADTSIYATQSSLTQQHSWWLRNRQSEEEYLTLRQAHGST